MEGWILASGDADEDERVQTTTDGEWLVLTIEPVPAPRCTVVVVDTPDQPRSPAIELSADPEEAESTFLPSLDRCGFFFGFFFFFTPA